MDESLKAVLLSNGWLPGLAFFIGVFSGMIVTAMVVYQWRLDELKSALNKIRELKGQKNDSTRASVGIHGWSNASPSSRHCRITSERS